MKSAQQRQPLRREPVRGMAFSEGWGISPVDDWAAARVNVVRCAVSWSADVFTVARGDCAELASCDFAAPHRNGGCGLRGRWPATHQKDKSRGASGIPAFDSWFDIDLLIANW